MRCQVVVLIWAMEVEVQEVHLLVTISVGHRPTDGMKWEVCLWLQTKTKVWFGPELRRRGLEEDLLRWGRCRTR